jgi:hypothetical protein
MGFSSTTFRICAFAAYTLRRLCNFCTGGVCSYCYNHLIIAEMLGFVKFSNMLLTIEANSEIAGQNKLPLSQTGIFC